MGGQNHDFTHILSRGLKRVKKEVLGASGKGISETLCREVFFSTWKCHFLAKNDHYYDGGSKMQLNSEKMQLNSEKKTKCR